MTLIFLNTYELTVQVSDAAGLVDTHAVTVMVQDGNDPPEFTGQDVSDFAENLSELNIVNANDPNGDELVFSLVEGSDAELLQIKSDSANLKFEPAPNFEQPVDSGNNNTYVFDIQVTDGEFTVTRTYTVNILDLPEAPVFTNESFSISLNENLLDVLTVTAQDDDGDSLTFDIFGGADAGKFAIDSQSGLLTFEAAPDFENPTDFLSDNVYALSIRLRMAYSPRTKPFGLPLKMCLTPFRLRRWSFLKAALPRATRLVMGRRMNYQPER